MSRRLSYSPIIDEALAQKEMGICLINCFFGQRPAGLSFVLDAFAQNTTVNFLLFSDCISPNDTPDNITVIPSTLTDIRKLAAAKLGLPVHITHPYKLCDFYAAYGKIFEDYLVPFSFWGTVDLDVLLGHIPTFITSGLLNNHDVISGHEDYVAGHFTLYRNTPAITTLYSQSHDVERVFLAEKHMGFEECGQRWMEFRKRKKLAYSKSKIDSITHVLRRLAKKNQARVSFNPFVRERTLLHNTHWLLAWQNGHLYDVVDDQEILYFHFHMMQPGFRIPDWTSLPDTFYINKHGFFI